MIEDNNEKIMNSFVDSVITARQSIKSFMQPRIKEIYGHELTYEMFQVLNVLWRQKSDINQQDIAKAIQKSKASITPLLDSLARLKLIVRTEDGNDRRNKIISLTNDGRLYKKKFDPLINEFYTLFRGELSDVKIRELTELLLQMSNNVSR